MRILVGWDDPAQADLIRLYLNVDDSTVEVKTSGAEFLSAAESQEWDAIVLTTALPDHDTAFANFERIRSLYPNSPIIAAALPGDIYRLARYLTNGLRAYVVRDSQDEFLFLLRAVIEGAVQQVQAERERLVAEKLRREIDSVRQLQESILPGQIDCPHNYHIVARYESSQIRVVGGQPVTMAGGDYYDAFTLPDDSIVVLVGDASGHGMKACMSIMTMHTLIRMIRFEQFRDPANFVAYVNKMLCRQSLVNAEGGFITLLYGVLNPNTHQFRWASAGHPAPLLQCLKSGTIEVVGNEDSAGLPIGIDSDAEYETHLTDLPDHCRLMLYTDGIAEAFPGTGRKHEEFGLTGIERTLTASSQRPLEDTLARLFEDSAAFTEGQGRHDDSSVLLLERLS